MANYKEELKIVGKEIYPNHDLTQDSIEYICDLLTYFFDRYKNSGIVDFEENINKILPEEIARHAIMTAKRVFDRFSENKAASHTFKRKSGLQFELKETQRIFPEMDLNDQIKMTAVAEYIAAEIIEISCPNCHDDETPNSNTFATNSNFNNSNSNILITVEDITKAISEDEEMKLFFKNNKIKYKKAKHKEEYKNVMETTKYKGMISILLKIIEFNKNWDGVKTQDDVEDFFGNYHNEFNLKYENLYELFANHEELIVIFFMEKYKEEFYLLDYSSDYYGFLDEYGEKTKKIVIKYLEEQNPPRTLQEVYTLLAFFCNKPFYLKETSENDVNNRFYSGRVINYDNLKNMYKMCVKKEKITPNFKIYFDFEGEIEKYKIFEFMLTKYSYFQNLIKFNPETKKSHLKVNHKKTGEDLLEFLYTGAITIEKDDGGRYESLFIIADELQLTQLCVICKMIIEKDN